MQNSGDVRLKRRTGAEARPAAYPAVRAASNPGLDPGGRRHATAIVTSAIEPIAQKDRDRLGVIEDPAVDQRRHHRARA